LLGRLLFRCPDSPLRMPAMSLTAFITTLLADGVGAAPAPGEISSSDRIETADVLETFELDWRLNMPGEAPAFHRDTATWAAIAFYRACQYAVFRDEGPEFRWEPLAGENELCQRPEAHYSVDLVFRFLPDLLRNVRAAAIADPLGEEILAWARRWPLSSVGVSFVESGGDDCRRATILRCPSLLRMYVDRIIARRDVSRLNDEAVRQAVAAAIGMHPELASEISAALDPLDKSAHD
jgi:hypothetical protein